MKKTGKKLKEIKIKMPLPKPCSRCNERFVPTGTSQKLCEKCLKKSQLEAYRKRRKENER